MFSFTTYDDVKIFMQNRTSTQKKMIHALHFDITCWLMEALSDWENKACATA
jgi:hypothetical protein